MATLIAQSGFSGKIGGTVTVYGTSNSQTVTIVDQPGTITFDASFNRGGDVIAFTKAASEYKIVRSGSSVIISDVDTNVVIPVGTSSSIIQFADGDRSLRYDNGFKIADQAVTDAAVTITATATAKSALANDTAAAASTLITNAEKVYLSGKLNVFGSNDSETLVVLDGSNALTLDPSFNRGGDALIFPKSAASYTAVRNGSSITLSDTDSFVVVPVGTVGITAEFGGDKRSIAYINGDVKVGSDIVRNGISSRLSAAATTSATFLTKITSPSIPNTQVSISFEALNFADINGDGKLDIVMANGGLDGNTLIGAFIDRVPVTAGDHTTTVLLNDGSNRFIQLDTSSTAPTGWVNDFIFLKDPNGGNPFIIGIDHGREVSTNQAEQLKYLTKLSVFQYQNGKLVDLTDRIPANVKGFWHNAMYTGDLNGDGIEDFVVARMDNNPNVNKFYVFYGDKNLVFTQGPQFSDYASAVAPKSIGTVGSVVMVKLGASGELGFVALPYQLNPDYPSFDSRYADIFSYKNGAPSDVTSFLVRSPEVPDKFGYNYALVADINGDGLQDIIGEMEAFDGSSNQHIFAVMIQNKNASFDTSFIRVNNSILLGVEDHNNGLNDSKFQLVDINGDGKLDIFYGMWFGARPSTLAQSALFGDGNGNFVQNTELASKIFRDVTWDGTARTYMSDLNSDGLGDLIILQDYAGFITPIIFINQLATIA